MCHSIELLKMKSGWRPPMLKGNSQPPQIVFQTGGAKGLFKAVEVPAATGNDTLMLLPPQVGEFGGTPAVCPAKEGGQKLPLHLGQEIPE